MPGLGFGRYDASESRLQWPNGRDDIPEFNRIRPGWSNGFGFRACDASTLGVATLASRNAGRRLWALRR